jgi:3-methyl-2-oxobutanoate hydroxymethyltransferase
VSTSKVTVSKFADLKARREPITVVTAYDATMARLFDEAEVEGLMVGDSLGMVIQGHDTTLPVTLDEMIYHTRCVSRGKPRAHVIGDLPFLSYQTSVRDAVCSAGRLVKEGGAESVKLEGGVRVKDAVRRIVDAGIPVMGHIGLTPQSVHQMGGFKVQGRGDEARRRCLEDADALVEAGVFSLVIEGVPSVLADEITSRVPVPTIGIGAGPGTDGQVLVCYDLLGMYRGLSPKFVRRFAEAGETIVEAARSYVRAVKLREFPAQEHTFQDVPAKATERAAYGGAPADPKNDP